MANDLYLMNFISQAIASAVKELLETKHLFQSIEIPVKPIEEFIRNSTEECKKEVARDCSLWQRERRDEKVIRFDSQRG